MNTVKNYQTGVIENYDLFAPKLVDREEYFASGHRACQGCIPALALRMIFARIFSASGLIALAASFSSGGSAGRPPGLPLAPGANLPPPALFFACSVAVFLAGAFLLFAFPVFATPAPLRPK